MNSHNHQIQHVKKQEKLIYFRKKKKLESDTTIQPNNQNGMNEMKEEKKKHTHTKRVTCNHQYEGYSNMNITMQFFYHHIDLAENNNVRNSKFLKL